MTVVEREPSQDNVGKLPKIPAAYSAKLSLTEPRICFSLGTPRNTDPSRHALST